MMKHPDIKKEIFGQLGFENLNILKLPHIETTINIHTLEWIIDIAIEMSKTSMTLKKKNNGTRE